MVKYCHDCWYLWRFKWDDFILGPRLAIATTFFFTALYISNSDNVILILSLKAVNLFRDYTFFVKVGFKEDTLVTKKTMN